MIIAFTGKMGAGKSTAIEELAEIQPKEIHLVKFAAPLYDMQEFIYRRVQNVYRRPSNFIKDRKLLQFLGTDWGRNVIGEDVWVNLWKDEVRYTSENFPRYITVCDDLRFDNEAVAVKASGGVIIQIISDNRSQRIDTSLSSHASESGIDKKYIDHTLVNNGTIKELRDGLKEILNLIAMGNK